MGFVQTPGDPCIYVADGDGPFMIAVHVDDLILAGTTDAKIAQVKQVIPMTIYEDNKAAISMFKNPQFHGRAKHVDIKCHFVRDHVYTKVQSNILLSH